jgi:FkbM family methyltransferase
MFSPAHTFRLWGLSRRLRLGPQSTASLFEAYYFGRRLWLKRRLPRDTVVIDLPDWGRVPIRINGYDTFLLHEIFVGQAYRVDVPGVRTVLDLGANIGMATVYLHRLFPGAEFACVEPSPQNLSLLKQSVSLNGVRARVFEAAVGAEEGEVDLYLSPQPDWTSTIPGPEATGVVRVPQVSVPEVMRQMGWGEIDLLKIDVQGAEKFVLGRNNSWLRSVRFLVGESHLGVEYSYEQLIHDLAALGFSVKARIPETPEHGATFVATNTGFER